MVKLFSLLIDSHRPWKGNSSEWPTADFVLSGVGWHNSDVNLEYVRLIYDEKTIPPMIWDECQRLLMRLKQAEDEQAALAEVTYAHGVIRGTELLRALRPSAAAGLHQIFDEGFAAQLSVLREGERDV